MEIERVERSMRDSRSAAPRSAGTNLALGPAKHDARQHRSAAEEHHALVDALAASPGRSRRACARNRDDEAEAISLSRFALLEDDNLAAPAFALIARARWNRAWSAAPCLAKSHRTMGPAILISALAHPICAISVIRVATSGR